MRVRLDLLERDRDGRANTLRIEDRLLVDGSVDGLIRRVGQRGDRVDERVRLVRGQLAAGVLGVCGRLLEICVQLIGRGQQAVDVIGGLVVIHGSGEVVSVTLDRGEVSLDSWEVGGGRSS